MAIRLVVGGSGGIGRSFVRQLETRFPEDELLFTTRHASSDSRALRLDLEDSASISSFSKSIEPRLPELASIIVATGLLHEGELGPEKTYRAIDSGFMSRVMNVNALAPVQLLAALLGKLDRGATLQIAVLSARVGSIEDNQLGGWYSYRASKAALNQLLKTLAIELNRTHKGVQILALHPGTTDTQLSRPFQARVPEGKLFTADFAATALLDVMDSVKGQSSGQFLAWDGSRIPW